MFQDNLFRELIVDNFAGGGGASTGMELALGAPVDIRSEERACGKYVAQNRAGNG